MAEQQKIFIGDGEPPVAVVNGDESEPLRGRALYTSLAGMLVAAGVAFGLPLNDAQQAIVASLLAVALAGVAPQVVSWWARKHVNSPATMRKILARRT